MIVSFILHSRSNDNVARRPSTETNVYTIVVQSVIASYSHFSTIVLL